MTRIEAHLPGVGSGVQERAEVRGEGFPGRLVSEA